MHTWQCGKNDIIDYWRYPAYGLAAIPLIAFIVIMAVNGGVPLGGEAWKEANWGEADCTVETKAGAGSSFFGPVTKFRYSVLYAPSDFIKWQEAVDSSTSSCTSPVNSDLRVSGTACSLEGVCLKGCKGCPTACNDIGGDVIITDCPVLRSPFDTTAFTNCMPYEGDNVEASGQTCWYAKQNPAYVTYDDPILLASTPPFVGWIVSLVFTILAVITIVVLEVLARVVKPPCCVREEPKPQATGTHLDDAARSEALSRALGNAVQSLTPIAVQTMTSPAQAGGVGFGAAAVGPTFPQPQHQPQQAPMPQPAPAPAPVPAPAPAPSYTGYSAAPPSYSATPAVGAAMQPSYPSYPAYPGMSPPGYSSTPGY